MDRIDDTRYPRLAGLLLALAVLAGCTRSGPADEAQSDVPKAVDCARVDGAPETFAADRVAVADRAPAPLGAPLILQLHGLRTVSAILTPGREAKAPDRYAGLVPVRAERGGLYAVLIASLAWADVGELDPPRTLQAQSFQWITVCGIRFKSGLYRLEPGVRYVVQLWDSPDRELRALLVRLR